MGDVSEHFSRREFACKCGCGFDAVDVSLLEVLEDVRRRFGRPVKINSGNRCGSWNVLQRGDPNSYHTKGMAADIRIGAIHADIVADYLEERWPNCGIGRYDGRTHVDVRGYGARWDKRKAK